jgi:ABC-type transport system involved in multi-copper enzyme maturation permease subunit
MTVAAIPRQPDQAARLRPVPWWRMAWVTWRQHRLMLAGVAAFLGALAAYLVIEGLSIRHAYAAVTACRPASSPACQQLASNFTNGGSAFRAGIVAALLQVVPPLIGAFAGAPVLARELESGTFRYAWTQGFGRWRWTVAKLMPLAIVVAAAAGAFSVVFSWYYHPFFAAVTRSPLGPTLFDLRGVAFAAWTLAAFAIGALAGLLIRRVVPAMAATLAAWAGLAAAAGFYLRQHYASPLITSNPNVGAPAWVLSQWWTRGGRQVSLSTVNQALRQVDVTETRPGLYHSYGSGLGNSSPTQYLIQHGYTQLTSYEPASRFWPFQWIEGGWLLALSLLLIAATVWLVRRRAA